MKLIRTSDKTIVAEDLKIADNMLTRLIGLLSKTSISEQEALLITPCNAIHSVGMKFEFDAVFLDKNDVIVHIIHSMKPFKVSPYIKTAKKIVEMKAGKALKLNLQPGDKLEILTDKYTGC